MKCNTTDVSSGDLTWTPANRIPTTTGSVPVSVTVGGNGYCKTMSMSCGSVQVSEPPPSGTVSMDDGEAHKIEGEVTVICSTQYGLGCYADPPEAIDIGCVSIANWANSTNPNYVGCGVNDKGGSLSCTVPAGKNVYCKKQ